MMNARSKVLLNMVQLSPENHALRSMRCSRIPWRDAGCVLIFRSGFLFDHLAYRLSLKGRSSGLRRPRVHAAAGRVDIRLLPDALRPANPLMANVIYFIGYRSGLRVRARNFRRVCSWFLRALFGFAWGRVGIGA